MATITMQQIKPNSKLYNYTKHKNYLIQVLQVYLITSIQGMGGDTRPFYHGSIARSFQVSYTVLWVSDEANILLAQEDRFDSQLPRAVILLGTRYGLVV